MASFFDKVRDFGKGLVDYAKVYYNENKAQPTNNSGVSFTENEQDFIAKAYGYDNASEVFSGINTQYDNTINYANQNLEQRQNNYQSVYGDTVNQAKRNYENNASLYGNAYGNQAIQANSEYQQRVNAYGTNQNQLAQLGLTGSGYNAHLTQQAYGNMQNTKSNAYNQAEQGKLEMKQVYGNIENQARQGLNQGMRQADNDYSNVYNQAQITRDTAIEDRTQAIKQDYNQKRNEYDTNFANLTADLNEGYGNINEAKRMLGADQITKEQYKEYETAFKTNVVKDIDTAFENASPDNIGDVLNQADEYFEQGYISKEQRANYYAKDFRIGIENITSKEEYQMLLEDINKDKDKLGYQYQIILNELENSPYSITSIKAKEKAKETQTKETTTSKVKEQEKTADRIINRQITPRYEMPTPQEIEDAKKAYYGGNRSGGNGGYSR